MTTQEYNARRRALLAERPPIRGRHTERTRGDVMTEQLAPRDNYAILEQVVAASDLSKMKTEDRIAYYRTVCESMGLNPLTQPFQYITLNGKLTLYATRGATDQLRRINRVSTTIVARETINDVYVVTARASTPDGRTDESIGAVAIGNAKGDAMANAMMKAETKAKRRATLAIVGLGWLDESETDSIPGATIEPQYHELPPQKSRRDKMLLRIDQLIGQAKEQGVDLDWLPDDSGVAGITENELIELGTSISQAIDNQAEAAPAAA